MTLTRSEIRQLLDDAGIRPSRALGQNFVADPNTVRRIAALAELGAGHQVIEIGAGLGSLTTALAETGARVVAVELDRRLLALLRAVVEPLGVQVAAGDALRMDLAGLLGHGADEGAADAASWSLVGNLPYNVAVPLVVRVLDHLPAVSDMLVMVQREVGERLAAAVGSHAYGAVSVKVAYHASASVVGRVPPTVFVPRPRVESVLVRMVRRDCVAVSPDLVAPERLFSVVRAGFSQRRKMLRRSLAGVVPTSAFAASGINECARAEELSVEEWGRLAAWSV
ncbi:MAG TPA: 16S rRNA (adenine(1518)-N(6)/adenine(1519)-N(6))-dimethyltransferase RsmA [Acidimicrobiales bacterium]|nr:16S rRNA (adenine(1518)-N(6)/adenine(1519)-N(6))-dimethyltransferase RsmA [Acidimicrobiales bacterium]